MPPATPARISLPDRYRVVRHLASGGMASVWEAHDELLDRDVAVKLLAPHLGEDERARRRFQREARAAAGLSSHPHVVTIYDVGEHANRVFMVMEIMRGGTLAGRVKDGRELDTAVVARWMREAAEALDAAEAAGVVHRDIKPGNLLLDTHDRLAVADFGIARLAWEDQLTLTGQVLGTAAYISPEQAMGEPASAASDRYSLAVVAYELLTGSRPFEGSHFAAQARAHVEDPPPPPSTREPTLSRNVDTVMEKALAKDPRDRWRSSAEFAGALERALAEPKTAKTRPLGRFRRGHEAVAAGARDHGPNGAGRDDDATDGGGAPPRLPAPADESDSPRRRPASVVMLAAICALLLVAVAGAAILASRGGGDPPRQQARITPTPTHTVHHKAKAKKTATPTPTATATPTATPTATATDTPAPTATPTSESVSSPNLAKAKSLQLAGYRARQAGDYATALADAKAALAACGDSKELSPCGYALYEEGVALNRSGDPQAAIPVLQQRLAQYGDDSSGSVSKELQDAQKRLQSGKPGPKGHGKGKGRGRDGGD